MEQSEIVRRMREFQTWNYPFDLAGNRPPISHPQRVNRTAQRRRYFLDPLVKHLGGSLAGKRVLDLGCNAGYWALCAIEAGCEFIVGVDGRQTHIDQARFVFEANDVQRSRYDFVTGNVFDLDLRALGEFDVVLCLGLLYHVSKPMELLEKIAAVNRDILLVDTNLVGTPGSFLRLRREPITHPSYAVDYELVSSPTRLAMLEMLGQLGYAAIVLRPEFDSYAGLHEYFFRIRRAFVSAKRTDLSTFPAPVESAGASDQLRDLWMRLLCSIRVRLWPLDDL
jgi:SAM-dependent methyltransferase